MHTRTQLPICVQSISEIAKWRNWKIYCLPHHFATCIPKIILKMQSFHIRWNKNKTKNVNIHFVTHTTVSRWGPRTSCPIHSPFRGRVPNGSICSGHQVKTHIQQQQKIIYSLYFRLSSKSFRGLENSNNRKMNSPSAKTKYFVCYFFIEWKSFQTWNFVISTIDINSLAHAHAHSHTYNIPWCFSVHFGLTQIVAECLNAPRAHPLTIKINRENLKHRASVRISLSADENCTVSHSN